MSRSSWKQWTKGKWNKQKAEDDYALRKASRPVKTLKPKGVTKADAQKMGVGFLFEN
jgi:hypothetical protein